MIIARCHFLRWILVDFSQDCPSYEDLYRRSQQEKQLLVDNVAIIIFKTV